MAGSRWFGALRPQVRSRLWFPLQPIDDSNRGVVEALRVSSIQEQFVVGVADSLVEAVEDPGGRAIYWAIYAEDIPPLLLPNLLPHRIERLRRQRARRRSEHRRLPHRDQPRATVAAMDEGA